MEAVGFVSLPYIMFTLPEELGLESLPWGNWVMAGCFVGARLLAIAHALLTRHAGLALPLPCRYLAHFPQPQYVPDEPHRLGPRGPLSIIQ